MNEKRYNEYIVLAVEHVAVNGDDKHVITTSCFKKDGTPVKIWVTDKWYQANQFSPCMRVSLKWNKEYQRYDSIFPVSIPSAADAPAEGEDLPF